MHFISFSRFIIPSLIPMIFWQRSHCFISVDIWPLKNFPNQIKHISYIMKMIRLHNMKILRSKKWASSIRTIGRENTTVVCKIYNKYDHVRYRFNTQPPPNPSTSSVAFFFTLAQILCTHSMIFQDSLTKLLSSSPTTNNVNVSRP